MGAPAFSSFVLLYKRGYLNYCSELSSPNGGEVEKIKQTTVPREKISIFVRQKGEFTKTKKWTLTPLRPSKKRAQTCAHCLAVQGRAGIAKLSACARCGLVLYCRKDCQRAHWKANHKSFASPRPTRRRRPRCLALKRSWPR